VLLNLPNIIDVGQNKPIKQRCYLVSPKVQEAIREEVDKMLDAICIYIVIADLLDRLPTVIIIVL